MNFRTEIPLEANSAPQIDYHSKVLVLGSCFSEHMGNKLAYFKFQQLQNPFGILFHPLAIEQLISNASAEKRYTNDAIFQHNEQWHCFDAHSKLSEASAEKLLKNLNHHIGQTHQYLKAATHVLITLGTAWLYKSKATQQAVANCHKLPQKHFEKHLLSVEDISASLKRIITMVKSNNKDAIVIFTVSPVRHLKDGFIENTQSKAHLITAIHEVLKTTYTPLRSYYFPSYELMLDELRDYRFYAADMIHPNETAIQYIWERFQDQWISKEARTTMEAVETIQRGLAHRPFNPQSEAHQHFLQTLRAKQKGLTKQLPHLQF